MISLRQFWVKTLVSAPLWPCRLQRQTGDWQRAPITPPPPVGRFKIDTFRMFNQQGSDLLQNALANERIALPQTPRTVREFVRFLSFLCCFQFPTAPPPSFTAPPPQSVAPTTQPPQQFNTFVRSLYRRDC